MTDDVRGLVVKLHTEGMRSSRIRATILGAYGPEYEFSLRKIEGILREEKNLTADCADESARMHSLSASRLAPIDRQDAYPTKIQAHCIKVPIATLMEKAAKQCKKQTLTPTPLPAGEGQKPRGSGNGRAGSRLIRSEESCVLNTGQSAFKIPVNRPLRKGEGGKWQDLLVNANLNGCVTAALMTLTCPGLQHRLNRKPVKCRMDGVSRLSTIACLARQLGRPKLLRVKNVSGGKDSRHTTLNSTYLACEKCPLFLTEAQNDYLRRRLKGMLKKSPAASAAMEAMFADPASERAVFDPEIRITGGLLV